MSSKNRISDYSADRVKNHIASDNKWYTGSQFEWAEKPYVKPIYKKRFQYFSHVIENVKRRLGGSLRVLDAGCGDGYWLHRLSKLEGLDLTGMDYNPVRVDRARKIVPHIPLYESDLLSFDINKTFDIIIFSQVIEHIEDDMAILMKMRTLLNSDGAMILGTTNEGSWLHRMQRWLQQHQTDHVHFYTEKEISEKINSAGFSIDSIMREIFFIGNEKLTYKFTERRLGFAFLEFMTKIWPAECSDFYFECRVR